VSAEDIKRSSRYLAGTLADDLEDGSTDFGHDAELLLKFHGIYQQDDRDLRRALTQAKLPLDYSCMVRASVPGGIITREQWLALDRLANLADGKLRLTTRQGVQFHVVHKGELRELVAGINASLLTTLAACGDVVRNVMACPLPDPARQAVLQPVVDEMVARFRPYTDSYWDLWVNGEHAVSAERPRPLDPIDDVEPIYGDVYLPRKFKIAIGWPGDNCVDVFANDVGIVPTLSEGTAGELTGFVVLAGGGMGMSHSRPDDTYPLLAQPVGWVPPSDLGDVVEAIVTTQRDHGNRDDRSRARLKYLLEARGVEWLRREIERRTGRSLAPPVELLAASVDAHHGWEHDGVPADVAVLGVPVPSGKVQGDLRRALARLVADGLVAELRVTPRQDLLLVGVSDPEMVEALLRANGVALAADQ
jgi:sulfite reductase (ferredoxin)